MLKTYLKTVLIIKNNVLQVRKMNGITNKLIKKKPSNKVRVFIILIYIYFS